LRGKALWRTHYQIAATSIDVTDLLNGDFELVQLLEQTVTHLGVVTATESAQERLTYAEQALTLALDLQTDRVMALIARLTASCGEANGLEEIMPTTGNGAVSRAEARLRTRCAELNRLEGRAQPYDYAILKTGGRDRFSAMRIGQLICLIPVAVWLETQIRLRAAGLLTPAIELKTARWIARGLDARHAVEKVVSEIGSRRAR
jgi:hypothetical protein